jgi:3-oxoacyl-[acyl-carrier protein] reductase
MDGISRTLAKELRRGATANLVQVRPGTTPADLATTLAFLLQGRSALVDGQTWTVGPGAPSAGPVAGEAPLAGRVVAVTGAARGIGAAIARVLARDGASVVAIDVPPAADCSSTSPRPTPAPGSPPTSPDGTAGRCTGSSTTPGSPGTSCW